MMGYQQENQVCVQGKRYERQAPNTHKPIIDQETFDNVQRIRANVKRYPDGWGEAAPEIRREMYSPD